LAFSLLSIASFLSLPHLSLHDPKAAEENGYCHNSRTIDCVQEAHARPPIITPHVHFTGFCAISSFSIRNDVRREKGWVEGWETVDGQEEGNVTHRTIETFPTKLIVIIDTPSLRLH
jgi:hypothetical protein